MGLDFLFSALGRTASAPSVSNSAPSEESASVASKPPVPPPSPSPPLQASRDPKSEADNTALPSQAVVAVPEIRAQPWVRKLASAFAKHTVGLARVDLRRPTAPPAQQYVEGNILFFHRQFQQQGRGEDGRERRGRGSRGTRSHRSEPLMDTSNPFADPQPSSSSVVRHDDNRSMSHSSTGARIKLTRNVHLFKDKEGARPPLVDLGLGLSIEMDGQHINPIARIKVARCVSIKAFPRPLVKVSTKIPLSSSGLGLKLLYELPLNNLSQPWNPPSRLMVRLETAVGSGFHISPTGIEVDEKMVHFGSNLSLRAAVGVTFPRSLPIDWDQDDSSFKFKIHRLSLRSVW